jgi:hypothetical protein
MKLSSQVSSIKYIEITQVLYQELWNIGVGVALIDQKLKKKGYLLVSIKGKLSRMPLLEDQGIFGSRVSMMLMFSHVPQICVFS